MLCQHVQAWTLTFEPRSSSGKLRLWVVLGGQTIVEYSGLVNCPNGLARGGGRGRGRGALMLLVLDLSAIALKLCCLSITTVDSMHSAPDYYTRPQTR